MQYLLKIIISALVITLVSEIAKQSSFWGAVLASLPFSSILAFVFLNHETGDPKKVIDLSHGIFWLVIPSLALFLILPALLKKGVGFYAALGLSCALTVAIYFATAALLKKIGVL